MRGEVSDVRPRYFPCDAVSGVKLATTAIPKPAAYGSPIATEPNPDPAQGSVCLKLGNQSGGVESARSG